MFKYERLISVELSERFSKIALVKFGKRRHIPIRGESCVRGPLSTKAKDILRERIREIRPIGPMAKDTRMKISESNKGKIPWNKAARLKRVHETRSAQSKRYWDEFRKLPIEEQHRLNLKNAASRRIRIPQNCVICEEEYSLIPSQIGKIHTCRSDDCKRELKRQCSLDRKHTLEARTKMSIHAKKRHINEPRFGGN